MDAKRVVANEIARGKTKQVGVMQTKNVFVDADADADAGTM